MTTEDKNEESLIGLIKEVLAQKGGTAVLPCKLTDPSAGIVSIIVLSLTANCNYNND